MLKKVVLSVLVLATIGFGIFTLTVPVDAKPESRGLLYKDVCCGETCGPDGDYCYSKGTRECCIPQM